MTDLPPPPQVPGEMLKQVRFLYEAEVTRLNQRNLRRAIHQMHQHQQEQQAGGGKKAHEVRRGRAEGG